MRKPRSRTLALALAAAASSQMVFQAWAGPNAGASLWLDAVAASPAVDSTGSASPGNNFRVAVRVADARYLDSYSCEVAFDTSLAAFVRADADLPGAGLDNLLTSRGGSGAIFIGRISSRDKGRVTLAYSLAGSDSTKSPSGAGLLAVLEFQARTPGTAPFTIAAPRLLDFQGAEDSTLAAHGAQIVISPPTAARPFARLQRPGSFQIFDVLGRPARTSKSHPSVISF